jgi:segregation and condensation protein A
MEELRNDVFTRLPDNLSKFKNDSNNNDIEISLTDLVDAFSNFLEQKELEKPLNTKITNKEYSVKKRCSEIKKILKKKKSVEFRELFEHYSRSYIVITFLAILTMTRNQDICITHFVADCKSYHVHILNRTLAFQCP